MATLVKFMYHPVNDELFAYFPQLKTCYAHIGQHSDCAIEYVNECRYATFDEFKGLKAELESIGYDLKLCKGNQTLTTLK